MKEKLIDWETLWSECKRNLGHLMLNCKHPKNEIQECVKDDCPIWASLKDVEDPREDDDEKI